MPRRRAKTEQAEPHERRITLGGRKLRKLLARTKPATKIAVFAQNAGLERVTVYRVMSGDRWRHIDVDFALAVREATNGQVQVEDFASITAIPVEDADDKEEPRGRSGARAA